MAEEHQFIRKFIDTLVLVVSSFAGVLVFVKGYTLLFLLAIVLQYGAFISYATRLRGVSIRDNPVIFNFGYLVVLSACETGRGRVVKGEGIVGLTRAFMMAGAPRVLCSLWKVDDEATKALMVKFYELWNQEEGKGLPAATALKQAQEFVRSHERWKHPFYWAAWVLWGLPD